MAKRRKRKGLGSSKVVYTATKGLFEKVEYGPLVSHVGRSRCAVLKRFGRPIIGFLMTGDQVQRYERGEKIHIMGKAADSARAFCEFRSTEPRR